MSNTNRKNKQVTLYLDDVTKKKAVCGANKLGLSLSGYLRYLVNNGNEPNPEVEITYNQDGNKTYSLIEPLTGG